MAAVVAMLAALGPASVLAGTDPAASPATVPGQTVDLATALDSDGTFVGMQSAGGSVDTAQWALVSDLSKGEAPRFASAGSRAVTQAASWSALNYRVGGIGDGAVRAIAVSGSNVYVGGTFTNVAGVATADGIAMWNGSSWSGLGSNGAGNGAINGEVRAIAIWGSSVYVAGSFLDAGGNSGADNVARWTGSGWASLGNFCCGFAAINNLVNDIAVFGDSVYVGGAFTDAGGAGGPDYFARYGIGCDCWSALGSLLNLNGHVYAVGVSASGTLYIGGGFTNGASLAAADFALGWNGVNWFNLGSDGAGDGALKSFVWEIAVSGSDVYVGGEFLNAANIATADYIARYNAQSWFAMGSNGAGNGALSDDVLAIAVSGATVYAGGLFVNANAANADYVAQYNGSNWGPVGTSGGLLNAGTSAIAVDGGLVYVGGGFTNAAGNSLADRVALFGPAFDVWGDLGSAAATDGALGAAVNAIAVSGSNVYVGGYFSNAAGIPEADYIARWDGTNWSALGSNGAGNGALNHIVSAIAIAGNNIYVGGNFVNAGGVPTADYVARWNGASWSGLGSNGAGDGALITSAFALVATPTDLYVGGPFSNVAGIATADRVARWDGTSWSALGSNGAGDGALATGSVWTLAMSGGSLYAGGNFVNAGGVAAADRVARWTGSAWAALGSNGAGDGAINSGVVALAARPGGGVYVGGQFTNAGGVAAADYVARWNGSAWSAIGSSGSITGQVWALAVSGTNLFVGGVFSNAGGLATADYLARWNGTAWKAVGSNGVGNGAFSGAVAALATTNAHLYAGGDFPDAAGITAADEIARWGPLTTYTADGWIKKGSGSFLGNGIHNNDALGQEVLGKAAVGGTITYTTRIQNDGTAASAYRVAATGASTTRYQVKYFRNATEITSAVVGGTYRTTSLAPGATFDITARVKVLSAASVGSSVVRLLTIRSVVDPDFLDAVRFTGRRG